MTEDKMRFPLSSYCNERYYHLLLILFVSLLSLEQSTVHVQKHVYSGNMNGVRVDFYKLLLHYKFANCTANFIVSLSKWKLLLKKKNNSRFIFQRNTQVSRYMKQKDMKEIRLPNCIRRCSYTYSHSITKQEGASINIEKSHKGKMDFLFPWQEYELTHTKK